MYIETLDKKGRIIYIKDYNQVFLNSKSNLNRFEFGVEELKKIALQCKKGLIKKTEYNNLRKLIEKDLFQI